MGLGSSQDDSPPDKERCRWLAPLVGLLFRPLDEDLDRPDPLLVHVDMMTGRQGGATIGMYVSPRRVASASSSTGRRPADAEIYRHDPLGRPNVGAVSYPESLRDRISQDEAYPISRTALDSALSDAGVATLDMIYFLRAGLREFRDSGVGHVMEISYRSATADRHERTEIRIHAVPAISKQVIGVALTNLLADAAAWVRRAERSENAWRSSDHGLVLRWDGDDLRLSER